MSHWISAAAWRAWFRLRPWGTHLSQSGMLQHAAVQQQLLDSEPDAQWKGLRGQHRKSGQRRRQQLPILGNHFRWLAGPAWLASRPVMAKSCLCRRACKFKCPILWHSNRGRTLPWLVHQVQGHGGKLTESRCFYSPAAPIWLLVLLAPLVSRRAAICRLMCRVCQT